MREDLQEIAYDYSQMHKIHPVPSLNLPNIVELECLEPNDGSDYRVFICFGTKPWRYRACRKCGSVNIRSLGDTPSPRLIHDVSCGVTQVDIVLRVDRYQCYDCGESFSRQFEGIIENRQMTERLYKQIKRDSFRYSFTDVASQYGYSDTTVANIFDEYAKELESERGPIVAPYALGIDEKHIVHKMRAVFVDIENGGLLELRPDNKRSDIMGTIESMVDYDKNIKIVTMDMANGYKAYVEECLPYAKIIVDKYHVYQDLYQKITKTRTKILEYIGTQIAAEPDEDRKKHLRDVRDLAINNNYLFKFSMEKLGQKQTRVAAMADLCQTFPEFNHLRLLKEGFEKIYDCDKRSDAEAEFDSWIPLVPPSGANQIVAWEAKYGVKAELFKEFRVFYNAMKKWHKEVFNFFDETETNRRYTNAAAEGTNHLIQNMNSLGNGYSFERLRARALFWHKAAQRSWYSFDKQSVPKTRLKGSDNTHRTGFLTPGAFNLEYETYYEETEVLTEHKEDTVYNPTSVLAYYRAARKTNPEGFID